VKSLNNIQKIEVIGGKTTITYVDGTKYSTKDDITLTANYRNENDHPIIDHCI
jgi:hypothetical protein|tara:strand:- start:142 stop:300 length:159 start_codon:yes stop_codon:yes gene_type:complete